MDKYVFEADSSSNIPVKLSRMKTNIFSVIPLKYGKAIIGDIDKVIPMAAVSKSSIDENSISTIISGKCTLWIYSRSIPKEVYINSQRTNEYNTVNNILILKLNEANSIVEIKF